MKFNPDVLFQVLLSDVGPYVEEGLSRIDLPPETPVKHIAATCLRDGLFKKLEVQNDVTDSAALLKFLEMNKHCREFRLQVDEEDELFFGQFLVELDNFFHPGGEPLIGSYADILLAGDLGSGSNIGSNSTSFYGKMFESPLSATCGSLYDAYRAFTSLQPVWAAADANRRLRHGEWTETYGSRISFVPKDRRTSRVICVEPTLNMFFQLGIGNIMRERLKSTFKIDLETQPTFNRELARLGSLQQGYATIDLESASDTISIGLCKRVLPTWVFDLLMATRSPQTEVPGLGARKLDMISSMGNGFTFPLQTILFSCAVRAAYKVLGVPVVNNHRSYDLSELVPGNWGVFGDDICIVSSTYDAVCRLLTLLGFRVNRTKSFNEGPFRESCGHDYHCGYWVRAVYLKKLETQQDLTVAINLLNDWSARTDIPLPNTITYLVSCVKAPLWVPFIEGEDCGIRVPACFLDPSPYGGTRYRTYRASPVQLRFREDGVVRTPKGCKKLSFNPDGLLISFLRGELKSGIISVRSNVTRYRAERAYVPYWDARPKATLLERNVSWPRWQSAILLNLRSSG